MANAFRIRSNEAAEAAMVSPDVCRAMASALPFLCVQIAAPGKAHKHGEGRYFHARVTYALPSMAEGETRSAMLLDWYQTPAPQSVDDVLVRLMSHLAAARVRCVRCGGTRNFGHHGTCYRCHGNGRTTADVARGFRSLYDELGKPQPVTH